jgi:hypothetical protein
MRGLGALLLVLALTGTAWAQEPVDEPGVVEEVPGAPEDDPGDAEEPVPEVGEDACEGGGADADYAYCGPCGAPVDGADADYVYCHGPVAAEQLPLTGSEPLILALLGLGLGAAGAGLRLLVRPPGAART